MEYLSDERWGSPSPIQRETAMLASPRRVFERLEIPGEAGLVARLYEDGIIFEPAGEGQRYLYEELDAAKHLQRPDP